MSEVRAFGTRTSNDELIEDLAVLGYINSNDNVLDATYGLGRFWKRWKPRRLTRVDLNPKRSPDNRAGVDFRHLPYPDDTFDVVVLDGPYKLNGTSTGEGVATSDEDYGVENYAHWTDRHQLICDGITECVRVLRLNGILLVKCMDQVCSQKVRWQTRMFADHAEAEGCELEDMLHVGGYRRQPAGRSQEHARRDYSTMLVLRRVRRIEPQLDL